MMKWLARILIAAAVILPLAYMGYHRIQNISVAKDVRAELEAWYRTLEEVPPEENGALIIRKAMKDFEDFPREFRQDEFNFDNKSNLDNFGKYLAEKVDALENIERGLSYPRFQYATDIKKVLGMGIAADYDSIEEQIPSLLLFKDTARIFILKGRILEHEGKPDDAIAEYVKALRLATTLKNEIVMITKMIEVGVTWMILERLDENLLTGNLSKEQLRAVLDGMKNLYYEPANTGDMYVTEYYNSLKIIEQICEGTHEGRETMAFSRWHSDFKTDVALFKKWLPKYKGLNTSKFYEFPPGLDDYSEVEEVRKSHGLTLFTLEIPSILTAWQSILEKDFYWRAVIVKTAIRTFKAENGRLPESLDELKELVPEKLLVDPCSGNKLIYKKLGNDFLLYGTGTNGKDDGGEEAENPGFNLRVNMAADMVIHKPAQSVETEKPEDE
ncbi:MAG: hypothetical protein ACYS8W_04540 [Planctomycetota bacterium]|jgi:tetratricopeptide (TPR) repeat protein